ncbi:hypothetical protein SCLCIDRAFT_32511 [Scleroderma citrinum Foug A]|uniref:Uncharacterized protein n=1 Tax=Scleroderma citrinum Foug A TaxID=1036808 RepID=A0A0C3D8A9_9AGAM|nr:hypothetical protein SCLCIDRAFT_32511 [Scleroderma citrinum Foug A]
MVKIPELAEDRQNWKIYCTKFLEVAATFDCLEILAGRPYKGEDWDGCNALLCCMFMETVAPSIYFKIHRRTAHKNFKYLAKHFHDNEPIPHANELQCTGTATAVETPDNCPTSADTATERHAHAEWNTEDLSTTQDVDNGNVRRMEDPRTSFKASAQGTSTNCAEMTLVVLESMPHETQDQPHSSLLLTPRPPIEGEPGRCKQEVVDSVTTAGRTNGMAKMAKPTDVDVDSEKAPLGRDPAERACRVDEGDQMECESKSQLQQTKLLCKEIVQHSGIANENVPIAHGVPLEGEWTWCASSEVTNSKGNANAFNTAIEHADGLDKSTETVNTKDIESEGCEGGTDERASVDEADGDASHGTGPADTSNELTEFIAVLIEPEDLGSGGILRVCFGNRADGSRSQTDGSEGQSDVSKGHRDSAGIYLSAGGAKRPVYEMDGAGTHAGTLTGQTDASSVETNTVIPANVPENVRSSQKKEKPPDLPSQSAGRHPDEPDGCGNPADMSNVHTDAHSIANEMQTAGNISRNDIVVHATSQTFVFGQVESGDMAIAPDVEGKRARDGDDDQDGDVGGMDGTMSGGSVDLIRVNEALLAMESQYMRQTRRTPDNDSPMSSEPPI